MDAENILFE